MNYDALRRWLSFSLDPKPKAKPTTDEKKRQYKIEKQRLQNLLWRKDK